MRVVPESGQTFQVGYRCGRWTILGPCFYTRDFQKNGTSTSRKVVVCECDCGTIRAMYTTQLTCSTKRSNSCGCLVGDVSRARSGADCGSYVDGRRSEHLNKTYRGIKERCYNQKCKGYQRYGKRGIVMCDEWLEDYTAFREWSINNGYKKGLSIDRINVNGNYEPSNCRWATFTQQARNRTNNRPMEAFGETKLVTEWFEDPRCCVTLESLWKRLERGWELERALTEKRHPQGRKRKEA